MAFTHGMNVEDVRRLGSTLQAKAEEIRTILNQIDSQLNATTWVGPDAEQFKGQWWPEHKASLSSVAERINGFGQSALNNASEQESVSGH